MKITLSSFTILLALSFLVVDSYAQIESFYPEANKYCLMSGIGYFGLFCSIQSSTPVRDSICISPVPPDMLTFGDSTGREHKTNSCCFIIIDSTNQFSYELWQVSFDTGKKFIIPFDKEHFFRDSTFIWQFYIQLLVKKDNAVVDSLSPYFSLLEINHIKSKKPSFLKPDISLNNNTPIEIYDLMGRKVKTLSAHALVNWQVGRGVYVVRVVGERFINKKIMCLQ